MSTTAEARQLPTAPARAQIGWQTELRAVMLAALLLYLASAAWLAFVWRIGNSDALSRTGNAFYVLYSRDPHLAAIGFVWPVMPTMLRIPLLPLARWLGDTSFAGSMLSSLAGAINLAILAAILRRLGTRLWLRVLLVALTAFHPAFWYLCASGLAEPIVLVFMLATVLGYLMLPERVGPVMVMGVALAAGFYSRYEMIAMIAASGVALVMAMRSYQERAPQAVTGRLVALLTPPFYAIGMWMLWNWLIMGDPLFFQRSDYSLSNASDVARTAGPAHVLYTAWGNPVLTVQFAVGQLVRENLAFVAAVPLTATLAIARRNWPLLGLVLLLVSVPAFTSLQVLLGTLPPYLRYWAYVTPFATVLVGALAATLTGWARTAAVAALVALMVASYPVCLVTMGGRDNGLDEQRLSARILNSEREPELRQYDNYWRDIHDAPIIARVLDERSAEGLVLVDSVMAYKIITMVQHPDRLVITSDRDFRAVLENPPAHVRYVLVLNPGSGGGFNAIAARHPELFKSGAAWAELDTDFTTTLRHWKLYRVVGASDEKL
jgi:hypothetical protein